MGRFKRKSFLRGSLDISVRWLGSRRHAYVLSWVRQALPAAGHHLPSFGPRTPTRRGPSVKAMLMLQVSIFKPEEPRPLRRPPQPDVNVTAVRALLVSTLIGLKTLAGANRKGIAGENEAGQALCARCGAPGALHGVIPAPSGLVCSPISGLGPSHGQSRGSE